MAQIMCYYKYPKKGIGSNCYTHPVYGQLCADFEKTNYNWINPTNEDYKLLSYHVGVGMNMGFCSDRYGSVPLADDYFFTLDKHFGYTSELLSTFAWDTKLLMDIIEQQKPIFAILPGDPGHAVVLDGFDSNGFLHINFGWGGISNGYYLLNNSSLMYLRPFKFGTNISQAILMQPGHISLNKEDSLVLVSVKNNISNLNWDLSNSRMRHGITTVNGRVIGIDISSSNMIGNEGSIPENIGNLKELLRLNIAGKLHGTIPNSIPNLKKLRGLQISNFSGTLSDTIPENIGNLSELTHLSIYNSTQGTIPTSIANLKNLHWLNLQTGNLEGIIPENIYNLTNLQILELANQKITGELTENFGKLKNLNYLDLSGNKLSGKIPFSIGEISNLTYVDLSENQFNGQIPSSFKNCNQISFFKLKSNKLEGKCPAIFREMKQITNLDLSKNLLTEIPEDIGNLSNLLTLNLNNNLLTSLPDSLNQLRALNSLSANSNKIKRLSENMNQLTSLSTIDLSNNEITYFHNDLYSLSKLTTLNLNNNKITRLPTIAADWNVRLFSIQNNELTGYLHPNFLRTEPGYYRFDNNCFVYNDIPAGTDFTYKVGAQKTVKLSKTIFKGKIGDTIQIDIRKLINNLNKNDKFLWCQQPKVEKEFQPQIDVEEGPVLHLVLTDRNISNRYYCVIKNDSAATWKDPESSKRYPCLSALTTERVSLDTLTKAEFLLEKYPESYIVGSENILKKEISDKIVTLISPFKMRGLKKWEGSADGKTWHELSGSMSQNDLKTNLFSVKEDELIISPKTPSYYRCALYETNCATRYSDTIKVNPYGKLICDTTLNVQNKTVTIKKDSIELTIPQGITSGNFRLTIVKLDKPPVKADSVYRMSSVYDVTVSFGDSFYLPIVVKLKNLNKKSFNQLYIENYKAVSFNDITQKWEYYKDASINLKDTTLTFGTYHFTKLGYYEFNDMNYTHIFTSGRVNVIYRYGNGYQETNFFDRYNSLTTNQGLRDWQNTNTDPDKNGNPFLIQDIAQYMNQIITKCDQLGLETPSLRFNVYVYPIGNYGQIGAASYLSGRGFLYIDPIFMSTDQIMDENRKMLMTTLAHEYTHYTQDYYMSMLINNYFWQEAVAPIGGRMIWNIVQLPETEPEMLLRDALSPSNDNGDQIFQMLPYQASPDGWDGLLR
jgi:Leucine-rich repeat (LRR) protein